MDIPTSTCGNYESGVVEIVDDDFCPVGWVSSNSRSLSFFSLKN